MIWKKKLRDSEWEHMDIIREIIEKLYEKEATQEVWYLSNKSPRRKEQKKESEKLLNKNRIPQSWRKTPVFRLKGLSVQYNSLIQDPHLYISSRNSKTSIKKETLNRKTGHQQRTDNQTGFLSTTEDVRGQWDHVFTFSKENYFQPRILHPT